MRAVFPEPTGPATPTRSARWAVDGEGDCEGGEGGDAGVMVGGSSEDVYDRNRREYWVSWAADSSARPGAAPPRSSSATSRAATTAAGMAAAARATMRTPALWPSGTRRTAALDCASAQVNAKVSAAV